jgi:hypothetical protein
MLYVAAGVDCAVAAAAADAVLLLPLLLPPAQVFLQRSAVNLLGVVLDVPEFFWSAPDHLQVRGFETSCGVVCCDVAMC